MNNDKLHFGSSPNPEPHRERKRKVWSLGFLGIASIAWLAFRAGTKPSRLVYPCQRAALSNLQVVMLGILSAIPSLAKVRSKVDMLKPLFILGAIVIGSLFITSNSSFLNTTLVQTDDDYSRIPIELNPISSSALENVSDLFFVQNATNSEGNMDQAITALIGMMDSEDLHFYNSISSPTGLIGSNDVVLLKFNGQWNYRGGTNTDLIKSVIQAILNHPDGFTGEVVVADNGQGLGGLDFPSSNAFDHSQGLMDVIESFTTHNVSAYLWDTIREASVNDYDEGDFTDGYVLSDVWNADTEIFVSYPKFRTEFETYLSLKKGIWNEGSGFDSDRLKIINMPVMKSHFRYGVTGCIKNYMGVPKGHIVSDVSSSIPHEHFSIANGGMATLMVETRAPILNILDMTWVNAHPMESSSRRGPWSTYTSARFTDIIGASQDPVALDYWASQNILCPTAEFLNYTEYSSLDPDYAPLSDQYYGIEQMDESFHNYLERSMIVFQEAGFQATMNQTEMNIFVTELDGHPLPSTTSTTSSEGQFDIAFIVIIPISIGLLIVTIIVMKRRGS